MVKKRNPPVRDFGVDDYLLRAKVVNGATTTKKVIAENDFQVSLEEGR